MNVLMNNKLLKLVTTTAVFALGMGVVVSLNQKPITKVEAAQHIDNYDPYTYSGTYYDAIDQDGTEGLGGTLRKQLTSLIYPKQFYSYSGTGAGTLAEVLQDADEDPTNSSNMVYLYTRNSIKKNAASSWNREHVWPQSTSDGHWGKGVAGTDILHIRPTYNDTNNKRSSYKYGVANTTTYLQYNGMNYGKLANSYFEPLDDVKGDVARIIMYVWTTYHDHYAASDSSYSNMPITNVFQSYDVLLQWHTQDRPDEMEGNRNDFAESSKQKNRNPFVDHPEYAWKIFGDKASSSVKEECRQAYPVGGDTPTPTKTLTGITLSGEPSKKSYLAGQTFDPTGLTVTAHYDDNSTKTIPINSCIWEPSPLEVGTTSVTCKYGKFTATYNGIEVAINETTSNVFTVDFAAPGEGSERLTPAQIMSNQMTENSLIQSVNTAENLFAGDLGLKFGSSSSQGTIVMTIVPEARHNIASIEVNSTQYKNDAGKFTVKLDNTVIASDIQPGVQVAVDFEKMDATTITFATTEKRGYLNSIVITIEEPTTEPIDPSSSSSEPPVSSSDPVTSSEMPVSSVEQSSSGDYNTSATSNVPSEQGSSNSSDGGKKQKSGCKGSIIGISSIISLTALVGLVFVFSKKKK